MKRVITWIKVMFHPAYWLMTQGYSARWDQKLRRLMREHKFSNCNGYTAKLGEVTVWIENHPYASFSPYAPMELDIRPSRATVMEAHEKLIRDLLGCTS